MGTASLSSLIAARADDLAYYSPYYFLQQLSAEHQQNLFGVGAAARWSRQTDAEIFRSANIEQDVAWLLRRLQWDSDYFGKPVFRLFTGLFHQSTTAAELACAAKALRVYLAERNQRFYAFGVIPSEDIRLLQGLTAAGWRVVESRLTYYNDNIAAFSAPRYSVRAAAPAESALIGRIAATAINPFDRVHADDSFSKAQADAYLARYAENTVTGNLAATVLVPADPNVALDSFLAISDLEDDAGALGTRFSRVLLTAVGPANRGWHVNLVTEAIHRAQALSHEAVLMTTQATNHAVFRTCEKLGFKLGAVSHVLACNSA